MSGSETGRLVPEVCAACGMEMDSGDGQAVPLWGALICSWCWSNDCCRVSQDAAAEAATADRSKQAGQESRGVK